MKGVIIFLKVDRIGEFIRVLIKEWGLKFKEYDCIFFRDLIGVDLRIGDFYYNY